MNTRFQNALARKPQGAPPVWFMRQAGRYHKHYQALRAKHSFEDLCRHADLAAQVALGPVEEFDFDVSILFSDILFVLEAMGMGLKYTDEGPRLAWQLNDGTLANLRGADDALPHMQFQLDAVRATRALLPKTKSLIGFVGAPWTLFTYAVQGKHDGNLIEAKRHLHLFEPFCAKLLPLLERNIALQFEGGAEIVMLFDTAAGELDVGTYHRIVLPALKRLSAAYPGRLGYYSKYTHAAHLDHDLFRAQKVWAGLGVDHRWQMPAALATLGRAGGFVQGNFDQSLLFLDGPRFEAAVRAYLEPLRALEPAARAGWVCGLGHGVLPKTPEANVKRFVEIVRETFDRA